MSKIDNKKGNLDVQIFINHYYYNTYKYIIIIYRYIPSIYYLKYSINIFRLFCDRLVDPEDSEIFAFVSCIADLPNSPLACLMEPESIEIEEDHDQCQPMTIKMENALVKNAALRAATSEDSMASYEDIKAEKLFVNPLNIRHVNKVPFTRLLRLGTTACCFYHEALG